MLRSPDTGVTRQEVIEMTTEQVIDESGRVIEKRINSASQSSVVYKRALKDIPGVADAGDWYVHEAKVYHDDPTLQGQLALAILDEAQAVTEKLNIDRCDDED